MSANGVNCLHLYSFAYPHAKRWSEEQIAVASAVYLYSWLLGDGEVDFWRTVAGSRERWLPFPFRWVYF